MASTGTTVGRGGLLILGSDQSPDSSLGPSSDSTQAGTERGVSLLSGRGGSPGSSPVTPWG